MFKNGMYSEVDVMSEMTTRSVTYLSKFVETWPKIGKNYSEIIVRASISVLLKIKLNFF